MKILSSIRASWISLLLWPVKLLTSLSLLRSLSGIFNGGVFYRFFFNFIYYSFPGFADSLWLNVCLLEENLMSSVEPGLRPKGCYGDVPEYFVSRREMPKLCDENRCFRMDACYKESYKRLTGLEASVSYKIETPKWRTRSE